MLAILRILVALIAIGACGPSHAVLVRWTLNDVTFTDFATASGSFIIDTEQTLPGDPTEGIFFDGFDITTTDGFVLTGKTYRQPFTGSGVDQLEVAGNNVLFTSLRTLIGYSLSIVIDADFMLTTSGTYPILRTLLDGTCDPCSRESSFVSDSFGSRSISGGSLTATVIPEPATFAFLAIAIGLIALRQRRTC